MDRIDELRQGQSVAGLRDGPVTLLSVELHGTGAAAIVFRDSAGAIAQQLLFASDLQNLTVVSPDQTGWTFAADPDQFKLAMEALRIRMAGAHDPMMAVSSSNIDPLPHQIRAVYGELLPKTPLRFLLADDPGAGKTIMAGLYAKELLLRGDMTRMLIVAPGGLVEQWQDELDSKFNVRATLLSRDLVNASVDGDPFATNPLMIARMDQLARDEGLLERLEHSEWDLVVVDEAHRMSASWWTGELRTTKRYELGQILGGVARHLLLMSATPHSGSEENFQAFLALLDPDRFEGQFRPGAHLADTDGLMRRMVKEDLLTFEGKPLFPERIAETVPYELSPGELELYEAVTHYVREEMNRADQHGDNPQRRTVGFALTVLQRRLASSTHAILRSLQRRRDRLTTKRTDMASGRFSIAEEQIRFPTVLTDPDELNATELEELEEEVMDAATAARTVAELDVEIRQLDDLVALAIRVRDSGDDRKWAELRSLLTDQKLLRDKDGRLKKLIIFTEHKDTLYYLDEQIRNVIGRDEAVLTIHGGTKREDRKYIREQFTQEPSRQVLVATDAAGEGLNLQAAHLMINYDLPWNPNRIEQRFGRIHRIGQKNVCRLWNLVADQTREGQVYLRLLQKMEQQRIAYGGKLFDVLGEAFTEKPLRTLIMDAIRYGDDPARLAEIEHVVNAEVSNGCRELINERALARESLDPVALNRLRREMDEACARRLQPHYVGNLFRTAFTELGGRIAAREKLRYQVAHVPAAFRQGDGARLVTSAYERVTFEPDAIDHAGGKHAELLAPGHPLLDAVIEKTIEKGWPAIQAGTILFDPTDAGSEPHIIVALTGEVVDGSGKVVSKKFDFVDVHRDGSVHSAGLAPYLDLTSLPESAGAIAESVMKEDWIVGGVDKFASSWAASEAQPLHLAEVREHLLPVVHKTRSAVRSRLLSQINYLHTQAALLRDDQAAGRRTKRRVSPDRLEERAGDLEARLESRLRELATEESLSARLPRLSGAALVVPAGLVGGKPAAFARETTITERRAVDAVLAAERALGRHPKEMPHNNKGFDIRSTDSGGGTIFVEVKGRIEGAESFYLTYNEVLFGKNAGTQHRLAIVSVSDDGAAGDQIRYLTDHFSKIEMGTLATTGVHVDWAKTWSAGSPPH